MSQGYAGTSTRDIAQAVGLTKGSLYYHFESKAGILIALATPLFTDMEAFAAAAASRPTDLDLLTEYVAVLQRHSGVLRTLSADPSSLAPLADTFDLGKAADAMPLAIALSTSHADELRARCAVGAIHAGISRTDSAEDSHVLASAALAVLNSA